MSTIFNPQDAPSAKMAEFYCTIGNNRYFMFHAKNFEAKANVTLSDVPRLGTPITGKKATGLEVKLSFTVYKCSEMFDNLIETFKDTGELPTFEAEVTQNDPSVSMGSSTKIYSNCIIDGEVLLSAFDAEGEFIEQTIEAYAMDYVSGGKYENPSFM